MILIEGPDKAGKTTLAKAIADSCGGTYFHFGVPPPNSNHIDECFHQLDKIESKDHLVYDRFGLSAFAYDFCLRANPNRSDAMTTVDSLRKLINRVVNDDHLWIYACAPEEVIIKRLQKEGDENDYIVERELRHIHHTYELLFQTLVLESKAHIMYYDSLTRLDDWISSRHYDLRRYLGHRP